MYRFLTIKELRHYLPLMSPRVLEFYRKNAGRDIPNEVIKEGPKGPDNRITLYLDKMRENDLFVNTRLQYGTMTL
jgi:hypothetical protein